MPGHVRKMRYPDSVISPSPSLFLLLPRSFSREASLSLLSTFLLFLSSPPPSVSLSRFISFAFLCRATLSSTANPRFEMRPDSYAERCFIPFAILPFVTPRSIRRVHYAMRILVERRVLSVRRAEVSEVAWTRKHFLLAEVMAC